MTAALNAKLDHPAYHEAIRLPKYNGAVTVFQACDSTDAGRVLRRTNPEWSQEDHLQLADLHATEAAKLFVSYNTLLEEAAQETFGRPYHVTDYRISAIACEEFSPEKKDALRFAAHARTNHRAVALAHLKAAGRRKNLL